MIRVEFHQQDDALIGYTVSGHAGTAAAGEDIVCAAVSSAAYMTANTITEIITADAEATAENGYMHLIVLGDAPACQPTLRGFLLHMQQMQIQYPNEVHLTITEV